MEATADKETRPTIKTDVDRVKETRLNCELVSDERINLTHEEAEATLSLKTFTAERPVDDRHVQELYDEMAGGRFRPEHVNLALCELEGETYRVNGQHTCWARLFMPKNYTCLVRKLVYRVKTREDLKKLYGVFDPSYASRSKNHLIKVMLVETAAAGDLSMSIVGYLATGFKFWKWGGDSRESFRRKGHNEVAAAIQQTPELFQRVGDFYALFQRTPHIKQRQGVIGAMFECFDRRPTIAEDFWKPVCDGLGLSDPSDPRYVLMKWLQERTVDGRGSKGHKVTSAEEMYRVCVNVWNRWRAGEKITSVRSTSRRFRAS